MCFISTVVPRFCTLRFSLSLSEFWVVTVDLSQFASIMFHFDCCPPFLYFKMRYDVLKMLCQFAMIAFYCFPRFLNRLSLGFRFKLYMMFYSWLMYQSGLIVFLSLSCPQIYRLEFSFSTEGRYFIAFRLTIWADWF